MAYYNLDRSQIHKRYLVIRTKRGIRDVFRDVLDKAMREQPQTQIIDYTMCRRCSVPCCDKRECARGGDGDV